MPEGRRTLRRAQILKPTGKGTVYCHCPVSDERYEMAFYGFERDRESLKYKCPAAAYGMKCKGYAACSKRGKGKIV